MNSFQNVLMLAAATGGCVCVAVILAILYRRQLRLLHERFMHVPLLGKVIALLGLSIAIVHGSTKTNGTDNASGPEPTNNVPPMLGMMMLPRQPTANNDQPTTVTNWTLRGAWKDWVHIDLPSSFAFPRGLDNLHRLTLMSYGELRTSLTNTTAVATLPTPVSIEPDVSSVSYGLTPSNTFLVSWTDACVNRDPSNRVTAAIELFTDGSVVTTFGNLVGRVAPRPPTGFVGEGQDEAWIRANYGILGNGDTLTNSVDEIISMGYAAWLNTWIGINQQNGRYQTAITVSSLPADGAPCYLVCGPFKVNVTAPGTYRFPLRVQTHYEARTYPTAVPLSLDHDDGYRGTRASFEIVEDPPLAQSPAGAQLTMPTPLYIYPWTMIPNVLIDPEVVYAAADGIYNGVVTIWCNVAPMFRLFESNCEDLRIMFNIMGDAELQQVLDADYIDFICSPDRLAARLRIERANAPTIPDRVDAPIFWGDAYHTETTNGYTITYVTATTTNSMALTEETATVTLPTNQSCYVAVYAATMEDVHNLTNCMDDTFSWCVSCNNGHGFCGYGSIHDLREAFGYAELEDEYMYGIWRYPLYLTGQRFDSVDCDALQFDIRVSAQNATDELRQTCVMVVIYPIDENNNIIGKPVWTE